ncbi:MAG: class I SAM-dependent methyltransferase [Acidimicrobiales bacterium]
MISARRMHEDDPIAARRPSALSARRRPTGVLDGTGERLAVRPMRPGPNPVAFADSYAGAAWAQGPARVYDRLAEVLVSRSTVPMTGGRVLDVGAGTGAAGRAALAAGAAGAIAVDASLGMLSHEAIERPPAVVGDILALPFADCSFDVTVAAFSLNHLTRPEAGLAEMARVTRAGGVIVAATYASGDTHPVKALVREALAARGWAPPSWYTWMAAAALPILATPEGFAQVAVAAGLEPRIEVLEVPFPDLSPADLIAWRLGMAQHAEFVAGMDPSEHHQMVAELITSFDEETPQLVHSLVVLSTRRP